MCKWKGIVVFVLFIAVQATSQGTKKATLAVIHTGNDSVGSRFVFALKEGIRDSSPYSLAEPEKAVVKIQIVSVDSSRSGASGASSALSVVVTGKPFRPCKNYDVLEQQVLAVVLDQQVLVVGSDRVKDMAETLLADVDRILNP